MFSFGVAIPPLLLFSFFGYPLFKMAYPLCWQNYRTRVTFRQFVHRRHVTPLLSNEIDDLLNIVHEKQQIEEYQ